MSELRKMLIRKAPPPLIAAACLGAGLAIHYLVAPGALSGRPSWPLGAACLGAGFIVMIWAWALFKASSTPLLPSARPRALVCAGPFRVMRNPMYTGIILMLSAAAFFTGDPIVFISPLAFYLTINGVYIPHEEATLANVFGQEYLDYKARVRRWL